MELLYNILSTMHIVVCVLLVFFILTQKGTGDGLFTTSSGSNPFMSGVEVASFLSKATKYLGIFFLINTLVLASLSVKIANKNKVIIEEDVKMQKNNIPLGSK
jgi:protein translocase SecG subunit